MHTNTARSSSDLPSALKKQRKSQPTLKGNQDKAQRYANNVNKRRKCLYKYIPFVVKKKIETQCIQKKSKLYSHVYEVYISLVLDIYIYVCIYIYILYFFSHRHLVISKSTFNSNFFPLGYSIKGFHFTLLERDLYLVRKLHAARAQSLYSIWPAKIKVNSPGTSSPLLSTTSILTNI